jgi:hypothetical protein
LLEIRPHEPEQFVAGDTVLWTKSLDDFAPSDGWTLSYRFVGAAEEIAATAVVATANTIGGWDVAIAAVDSDVAPGVYRLIGYVSNAGTGARHTVVDETVTIAANLATGTPASLQSDNENILAAIDARMSGRITADQESVAINGTQITRIPIEKLATLRGIYAARVWREQNPGRSNPSHALRFRHAR